MCMQHAFPQINTSQQEHACAVFCFNTFYTLCSNKSGKGCVKEGLVTKCLSEHLSAHCLYIIYLGQSLGWCFFLELLSNKTDLKGEWVDGPTFTRWFKAQIAPVCINTQLIHPINFIVVIICEHLFTRIATDGWEDSNICIYTNICREQMTH